MISLNAYTIQKVSEEGNKTQFEIGPLPTGYGHTLGNMIRRILLSSIPGSAVTAVKIDGVQHEYSTLEGLSDDILTVVLALKNVVVRSKVDEPITLKLQVKGKANSVTEVTAGDISKDSNVEVINSDYIITKISGAKTFGAELVVNNGVGYVFPDQEVRKELGMLPIDASFSPVTLVHYNVVPTRVGHDTDLDQLNLSVQTNGSITALEAFNIASRILNEMTSHLSQTTKDLLDGKEVRILKSTTETQTEIEVVEEVEKKKLLVEDMNLSTRLTNALLRSGIDELSKLEGYTEEELASIKGMGKKSLAELLKILEKHEVKII